jgi:hypothetical protein
VNGSIRDLWSVETDSTDWPKGLPEAERNALTEAVKSVLERCGPLKLHELFLRLRDDESVRTNAPTWSKAALYDWLYGCVERATRAVNCEERYHLPGVPVPKASDMTEEVRTFEYRGRSHTIRKINGIAIVRNGSKQAVAVFTVNPYQLIAGSGFAADIARKL